MRSAFLALALIALGTTSLQAPKPEPGNLSEALYNASELANGEKFCDKAFNAKLKAAFEARYGDRVRALTKVHRDLYGEDENFIVLSSCYKFSKRPSIRKLEDAFEPRLRELEKRYGGY